MSLALSFLIWLNLEKLDCLNKQKEAFIFRNSFKTKNPAQVQD